MTLRMLTIYMVPGSIVTSKMMSLRRVASTFKQIIYKKEPSIVTGVPPVNTNFQPFLKRTPTTLKGLARNSSASCKSADKTNETTVATNKGLFSTSQTKSTSTPTNNKTDKKQISAAKDVKKSAKEVVSSVKAASKGSMKVQLFVPKPTDAGKCKIKNGHCTLY